MSEPEPLSDILQSLWASPPIDLGVLRDKATSLIWLWPEPVYFTENGIATTHASEAMVSFTLDPDGETVHEHWAKGRA